VLYGSESELEDSDDEGPGQFGGKKQKEDHGARLRLDDDEPLNLLQGVASRITSTFSDLKPYPFY
jgi:ribosomal RNA-processing protein 12